MSGDVWQRTSRLMPALIIGYVLALALLRLSLSPFLEIDEAQFVGAVDLRLLYGNSHPPLYNWLIRAVLELTGWNWALSLAVVKYGFLILFHLLTWDAARRLGGPKAGILAVAASALLPQVVWMSVHTLAHSVMVLAATAAIAHALVLLNERQTLAHFAWLGAAAAIGVLGKFHFFLTLGALGIAIAATPEYRTLVWRTGLALALGVFAALVAVPLAAAVGDLAATGKRLDKLYDAREVGPIDVPYLGIDGLVTVAEKSLAWAGIAILVWLIARWWERKTSPAAPVGSSPLLRVFFLSMMIALGILAAIVVAMDAHTVHERYLTPVFGFLPIWLAARWPLARSARPLAALAAAAYLAALIGFWGMASFGGHRYGRPYLAFAQDIEASNAAPAEIRGFYDLSANTSLALGWPPAYPAEDRQLDVVLVWAGTRPEPVDLLPPGFTPAHEAVSVELDYPNWSGRKAIWHYRRYEPQESK